MSENLDLVRSIVTAWERGDYSSVEWQDPEIEFVIADGPTPGSWKGAAGITEGWGTFLSAWDDFHAKADEYRELDGGGVLLLGRFGGRGKTSGIDLGQAGSRGATLFQIRRRQVTRIVHYFDRDHVPADLGLEE
jgi:ketosteroid isomerase-like protein